MTSSRQFAISSASEPRHKSPCIALSYHGRFENERRGGRSRGAPTRTARRAYPIADGRPLNTCRTCCRHSRAADRRHPHPQRGRPAPGPARLAALGRRSDRRRRGSTDGTGAIARAQGATVLERAGSTIAAQRNRAIAAARNAGVFALDADERVSDALVEELRWVLRAPPPPAYRVRRENFFLGRERRRGRWGRDWQVRLFTRERRFLPDRVHERLEPVRDAGTLHATLRHAPYRNLRHQPDKMLPYAQWGAPDPPPRRRPAPPWG